MITTNFKRAASVGLLSLLALPALGGDGLRVAAWNITNYTGGLGPDVQSVVYEVFDGRSLDADVFLLQEFRNATAVALFVIHLNAAPGSPGDWAAAPFFPSSGSLNTALVYRTSKLDLIASVLVATGGTNPQQPRNVVRYDLRLDGYTGEDATISCYPSHMKAGSSSTDQARRLVEAQIITADAAALPAGRAKIYGGDMNTQTSSQPAHRELVGLPYNTGPFRDPIVTPGSWQNNSAFRIVHTQDPVGGGGMDDRYDQLLVSANLVDGAGFDYIGNPLIPYSISTWNDPNHSYRSWGNDGLSFNVALRTTGNFMVGPSIAQSIIALGGNAGHCPLYLDLRVPAAIGASTLTLDFGDVEQGDTPSLPITIGNAANGALWGSAVADLGYSVIAPVKFTVSPGSGTDAVGGSFNAHTVQLIDTAALGAISSTMTIAAGDTTPGTLLVTITANIVEAGCGPADLNGDGVLDFFDVSDFLTLYAAGDLAVDFNGDGVLDFFDVSEFLVFFSAGC